MVILSSKRENSRANALTADFEALGPEHDDARLYYMTKEQFTTFVEHALENVIALAEERSRNQLAKHCVPMVGPQRPADT
jgi:hypothetical protein